MEDSNYVSIIIPSRGRTELLYKTLDTIKENTVYPYYDINIVVDYDDIETYSNVNGAYNTIINYSYAKYVGSINNGAEHSKNEYIAFLADDVFVESGWLSEAMYTMQRQFADNKGIVMFYDKEHNKRSSYGLVSKSFAYSINNWTLLNSNYYHKCSEIELQIKATNLGKSTVCKRAIVKHLHDYTEYNDDTKRRTESLKWRDSRVFNKFLKGSYYENQKR